MFDDLTKEKVEEILDEPEPTIDRSETTVISLDQKIWGQLHDGRHNPDSRHADAYDIVQQSVDEGDVICPFSITRFFETDSHPDETFKRELYELMIDLSRNFCMRHYFDATSAEITAYIAKHHDLLPKIDPTDQVIGRGLAEAHGRYRITLNGEPIEDEWKINKFLRSVYFTRLIIKSDDYFSNIPEPSDKEERAKYVKTLESNRQKAKDVGNTEEERRKILINNSFQNDILPHLIGAAEQIDFNIGNVLTQDIAFNTFDGFYMQFPTYYCHLDLLLGRDFHWDRTIKPNDLQDIMPLAVAIPYTDIVVAEKFFAGVAYKQGLHERFDTTIRTDLQDLADYLTNT